MPENKPNNIKIFKSFAEALVHDMRGAIPSATGRTAKSIRLETSETGFVIYGGEQINYLINGRRPTSSGAKKGNPTLQEYIIDWIRAKSIKPKGEIKTDVALSWAISKSIHKKGYKGKGNIFGKILKPSRFAVLKEQLLAEQAISISSSIIKAYKP